MPVCWYCVLILCAGTVCWYCVLVPEKYAPYVCVLFASDCVPAQGAPTAEQNLHTCRLLAGANTRQAMRIVPLLWRTTQLMVDAYPNRLKRLYMVDLPATLWVTFKAMHMVQKKETRDKIQASWDWKHGVDLIGKGVPCTCFKTRLHKRVGASIVLNCTC